MKYPKLLSFCASTLMVVISINSYSADRNSPQWLLVDNFEQNDLSSWFKRDTKNQTSPFVENPQVTEIHKEESGNHYLIKKPAPDGVVGNRKALSFVKLPKAIEVGEMATIYTRIQVEYFPNNHIFGA